MTPAQALLTLVVDYGKAMESHGRTELRGSGPKKREADALLDRIIRQVSALPDGALLGNVQWLTPDLVKASPEYYLAAEGPGRQFTERAYCEHGYQLTDSCPACG